MKMRQLEKETGVHRETIRTYLRHGLIPEPERPKPNVADYDNRHVKAIAAIRDLQKNSSLTLPKIKAVIGGAAPDRVEASAFQHLETLVATRVGLDAQPILLESMCVAFPNALRDSRSLAKVGIVELIDTHDGPALSLTDSRLVAIWSEMRAGGFTEELGFTPEMLTFYIEPADQVASREAALFLERVEGSLTEEEAAEMLQIALRAMLDFFGLMRTKSFLRHIGNAQKKKADSKDT